MPGVPGTGARILIDFSDTAGAATGALLPTGRPVDRLNVPDVGEIDVSLVDIGNAHVFVRASDLGLRGTEGAAQLDADHELRRALSVSGCRSRAYGNDRGCGALARGIPATPILGIVSPPASYRDENGGSMVNEDEVDLVSRLMFMQQTHKTYAGTSTVCTGVASRLTGTLVHEVTRPKRAKPIPCVSDIPRE